MWGLALLMSINGWLMVRAEKKSRNIHGVQEPKGLQKMKRQKMNSAHEGISQPTKFSGCENSQTWKNFTLHQKVPAFYNTYKTEKTKNYQNVQMKARKITKKRNPKLRKLRKSQINLKMKQTKFQQKLE